MDVRMQIAMVFHLDKCIGCHTCSVACKNLWTDRKGAEYMWWNNVETKPGRHVVDRAGRRADPPLQFPAQNIGDVTVADRTDMLGIGGHVRGTAPVLQQQPLQHQID